MPNKEKGSNPVTNTKETNQIQGWWRVKKAWNFMQGDVSNPKSRLPVCVYIFQFLCTRTCRISTIWKLNLSHQLLQNTLSLIEIQRADYLWHSTSGSGWGQRSRVFWEIYKICRTKCTWMDGYGSSLYATVRVSDCIFKGLHWEFCCTTVLGKCLNIVHVCIVPVYALWYRSHTRLLRLYCGASGDTRSGTELYYKSSE